jgi:hypothetical protein
MARPFHLKTPMDILPVEAVMVATVIQDLEATVEQDKCHLERLTMTQGLTPRRLDQISQS